jgi:hypothetical protein
MPPNMFDKASRYAVKIDPPAFFAWVTGLSADRLEFRDWLDTRAVPLPHEPDQIGDTVGRIETPTGTEPPWAVAVEFQSEPDPLMFSRLMIYLGHVWQSVKPDPEPGSRFNLGAVVINLTGNGRASRDMQWPDAGFATQLKVLERNLASENADDLLAGIEAGRWSRALLPWLPLMTSGGEPGIIERWKQVAEGEPDSRKKANFASLALVFAEAAERKPIWEKALEGWNVIESEVVKEWQAVARAEGVAKGRAEGRAEGRVEGAAALVIAVLEGKFGKVPSEVEAAVRGCSDLSKLQAWATHAVNTSTLEAFRTAAGI